MKQPKELKNALRDLRRKLLKAGIPPNAFKLTGRVSLHRTSIYRVRKPCSPEVVGKWCLAWRSGFMPASAYWYYDTRREAREARARMVRP